MPDATMQARRTLETDLGKDLDDNPFEVYYQPIMNISTGSVIGFEALLRWSRPEHGRDGLARRCQGCSQYVRRSDRLPHRGRGCCGYAEDLRTGAAQARDLGPGIAMDDFGTGYSSLNYLRHFPFSIVKIDRSFIEGPGSVAQCNAIVTVVTDLCETLGMATLAEVAA